MNEEDERENKGRREVLGQYMDFSFFPGGGRDA